MRVSIEAMRVCKSHEVALEEVEWANTVQAMRRVLVEAMEVSVKII